MALSLFPPKNFLFFCLFLGIRAGIIVGLGFWEKWKEKGGVFFSLFGCVTRDKDKDDSLCVCFGYLGREGGLCGFSRLKFGLGCLRIISGVLVLDTFYTCIE